MESHLVDNSSLNQEESAATAAIGEQKVQIDSVLKEQLMKDAISKLECVDSEVKLLNEKIQKYSLNHPQMLQMKLNTIFLGIDRIFESTKQSLKDQILENVSNFVNESIGKATSSLSRIILEKEELKSEVQQAADKEGAGFDNFVDAYSNLEKNLNLYKDSLKSFQDADPLKDLDPTPHLIFQVQPDELLIEVKEKLSWRSPNFVSTQKFCEVYTPKTLMRVSSLNTTLFDYKTLQQTAKVQNKNGFINEYYSAMIVTQDDRFFSVGSLNPPYTHTYEFNFSAREMVEKAHLNKPTWCSTLCEVRKDLLITVGGYMPDCEAYDIIKN